MARTRRTAVPNLANMRDAADDADNDAAAATTTTTTTTSHGSGHQGSHNQ